MERIVQRVYDSKYDFVDIVAFLDRFINLLHASI